MLVLWQALNSAMYLICLFFQLNGHPVLLLYSLANSSIMVMLLAALSDVRYPT